MRVSSSRWLVAALAVFALQAAASSQTVETLQQAKPVPARASSEAKPPQPMQLVPVKTHTASGVSALIRKTYALAELSDDPALGAWIAENIPQIVQPGTWNIGDAQHKPVLSYFGPSKILLVYHTPTAHAEIEEFILSVKKSAAAKTTPKSIPHVGVAPAQFTAVDSVPSAASIPHSSGYPVPAQVRQPRHLFHFVIRYEGEGVIDSNVVDFMKLQGAGDSGAAQQGSCPVPARSDPTAPAASQKIPCMPECLPPATTSSSTTSMSNAVFSTALGASLIGNAFPVQLLPIAEAVAPRK